MYKIKLDSKVLYYPGDKEASVINPELDLQTGYAGELTLKVPPENPLYDNIRNRMSMISVFRDDREIFYGEVRTREKDRFKNQSIKATGALSFLADTILPQKEWHDIAPRDLLDAWLQLHNSQVEDRKKIYIGVVTIHDSNDSLYRITNRETTLEAIREKLVDRLGGYLRLRHEDKLYLDWITIEEYGKYCEQPIQFASNLLDYSETMTADDVATAVIPLGAAIEKESNGESEFDSLEKNVDITSVNDGKDYIYSEEAVKNFGWVFRTAKWDDVTVPDNLLKKATEYLETTQYENLVVTLTAVDLSLFGQDYDSFDIGDRVLCNAPPYGMKKVFPIMEMKIPLQQPDQAQLTLGENRQMTLTEQTSGEFSQIRKETTDAEKTQSKWMKSAIDNLTKQMTGNKGGYKLTEYDENGLWTRDLYMDAPDKEDATKVLQINVNGIAGSNNGYAGPYSVGMTLDGQIIGERILAESIKTEALSAECKNYIENKIKDGDSEAEKAIMKEVESSLKVLNDQIAMRITSTKELVLRKNYIVNGEQENLSAASFTVAGSAATVTESEFLNMKCLKIEFSGAGAVVLEQNVGTLPEGIYKISIETAFPESDGNTKRPNYFEYGFTGNRDTVYYNSLTADEYHSVSKEVKITEASKAVSVRVYGSKGNVAYITNIRCLREIQEFLDDLTTQIKAEVGNIELSVKNTLKSYSTTEEMNSAIRLAADNITSTVSKTYVTTSTYETGISDAKADTESKLKSYSTTEEMKSAIKQSAESITSTVSKTYVTTTTYETGISDAKADTDNKLKNYSTTTEMNSAIKQAADRITSTVKTVRVGSRNLILNSKGNIKAGFFQNFNKVTTEYGEFSLKSKQTYARVDIASGFLYSCRDYSVGEEVTWSYDIMYTVWNFPSGTDQKELWIGQRYTTAASGETATGIWTSVTKHDLPVVGKNGCKLNTWYHVTQTLTIPAQASANVAEAACIQFYNSSSVEASFTARIRNVKLEKGNVATDWTPAPEDVDKNIAAVSDKFADYSTTTEMQSAIKQSAEAITTTVSKKVGTNEIISKINQSAESVTIKASKINFNGLVTANSYFKILTDGSFACVKGTIGGFIIKNGSIFAKGTELSAIGNGFKVDGGFKIYCGSDTFSDQTDTFQVFNLGHVTSGGHLVFASDGTTVAYLSSSSKRYKDHVADMTIAEAEKMLNVPVVWFKYKENYLSPDDWLNGKKLPGFYAEDVYDIFPEAAQLNEDGEPEDWNFRVIIPAMMKLIQELYSERRKME
nr:phage tail protein [uncultured Blautia sp.]